ncbi:MAG: ABC transporter substrate-binding protein [Acidobacteria bacterium]|nr:ABC transporter substrate-binding protein [Acidobacteriota bacterium]
MRLILTTLFISLTALAAQPQRIVSTAPSFTETLFAVGAGDRVVAVSTYCHYPAAVDRLPRVGSYLQPNIEVIARLKPDLVLVHAEQKQAVAQLQNLGIRVLALRNTSLEDTLRSMREIGDAVGLSERGTALEKGTRDNLATISKRAEGRPPKTLLFIVGRTPGRLDGMIAVGKGSFLNELIRMAGGQNVLFDSPVTYPRISLEAVLRLAPDVIVDMGDMAVTTGVTEDHKRSVVKLWETQRGIPAVGKRKVFAVAADIFVVPGPRVIEAAEAFAAMINGNGQ